MTSQQIQLPEAQRIQASARAGGYLLTWTVYEKPRDYPTQFIARPARISEGCVDPLPVHLAAMSLSGVRAQIPVGLFRLPRWTDDESQILEVWM